MLKAPFPYFGGKSKIAPLVWSRLGNVKNYVEPFFGSGAVLLARPDEHCWWDKIETVNDKDGLLCVAPETRILMADLRWRRAGEVRAGDYVLGFDEHNGQPKSGVIRIPGRPSFQPPESMRKWRVTRVIAVKRVFREAYRLRFEDGTEVIASEDHLWLGGKSKAGGRGARWVQTKSMRADASPYRTHVLKLCDVVDPVGTREAGWVSGFFDGEGHIRRTCSGWRVGVTQKIGPEADRVEAWLREFMF
ncbi:MAG: DNA adenine methylase [Armatimonadota bacterium]